MSARIRPIRIQPRSDVLGELGPLVAAGDEFRQPAASDFHQGEFRCDEKSVQKYQKEDKDNVQQYPYAIFQMSSSPVKVRMFTSGIRNEQHDTSSNIDFRINFPFDHLISFKYI